MAVKCVGVACSEGSGIVLRRDKTVTFHILSSFQTIPHSGALYTGIIWFKDAVKFTSIQCIGEGYAKKGWEQLWRPEEAYVNRQPERGS